jgi:hypothetical protein
VHQQSYQNFSGLKLDFEQLRAEFLLSPFSGSPAVRDHCFEYLFTRSMALTDDYLSGRDMAITNQLRVLQEKLRTSDAD